MKKIVLFCIILFLTGCELSNDGSDSPDMGTVPKLIETSITPAGNPSTFSSQYEIGEKIWVHADVEDPDLDIKQIRVVEYYENITTPSSDITLNCKPQISSWTHYYIESTTSGPTGKYLLVFTVIDSKGNISNEDTHILQIYNKGELHP